MKLLVAEKKKQKLTFKGKPTPLGVDSQEARWLPGLGLEKHPPMVGPKMGGTRRHGGTWGGRGKDGAVRSSGGAACLAGETAVRPGEAADPRWPSSSAAAPWAPRGRTGFAHRQHLPDRCTHHTSPCRSSTHTRAGQSVSVKCVLVCPH